MNLRLLWPIWAGIIVCLCYRLQAQTVLETKPLSISSSCPGSVINVPFTLPYLTFTANTTVTVQLANGDEFFDIPTGPLKYINAINATVPMSLTPDVAYSVRVTTKNPDYVCTPSPTKLIVKGNEAKPPLPSVDSLTVDCMSTNQSSMAGLYSDLFFRLTPGATPRLYYTKQRDDYQDYAEFPFAIPQLDGHYVRDTLHGYFQLNKTSYTSPTYVYPVYERTYYISQRIDGCESELAATKLRIIWKAGGGPGVITPIPNNYPYGQVVYCQREQAYPLNVNGHKPPPENFQVAYWLGDPLNYPTPTRTFSPPVPDTGKPGYTVYAMNLYPIDASKGCANDNLLTYTRVKAIINPTPVQPATTTNVVTYYQGQAPVSLSATTTDSTATLVWYGINATGGVGTSTAPKPPTDQIGAVTYYVAQKIGSCESERVAISVLVNPALGIEDPTLAEAIDVFPNPTVSSLTIRIPGLTGRQSARFELVDLTGQSLLQKETQQETAVLPMTDYPNGSYLLLINVGDRKTTRRIMKM
ncbi:T9SS type A sorting domain-containing protein [Spirosoma gilvum]